VLNTSEHEQVVCASVIAQIRQATDGLVCRMVNLEAFSWADAPPNGDGLGVGESCAVAVRVEALTVGGVLLEALAILYRQ
jgi:hypothetical protein